MCDTTHKTMLELAEFLNKGTQGMTKLVEELFSKYETEKSERKMEKENWQKEKESWEREKGKWANEKQTFEKAIKNLTETYEKLVVENKSQATFLATNKVELDVAKRSLGKSEKELKKLKQEQKNRDDDEKEME